MGKKGKHKGGKPVVMTQKEFFQIQQQRELEEESKNPSNSVWEKNEASMFSQSTQTSKNPILAEFKLSKDGHQKAVGDSVQNLTAAP